MSFCISKSDIVLCIGENVIIFNLETNEEKVITLPKLMVTKETQAHNKEDIDSFHALTSVIFSHDGEYLAVYTNRKQLYLYRRKDLQLVSNRTLARAASKVRFSPSNDIVIADKSGDVYLYSTNNPLEDGKLLLGHLSMLLDVLVTDDKKYIITTDRDEKIRVSMFPNSYNIVSYCLGHEKFVTNIEQVPHDKNVLISCGGDGLFILWNYKNGEEISRVSFVDLIPEDDRQIFNERLKNYDFDESIVALPVKNMKVTKVHDSMSVIIASFYCSKRIIIYKIVSYNCIIKCELLSHIDIASEPIEFHLENSCLWVLTNKNITFYELKDCYFVENNEFNTKLKKLNESWRNLQINTNSNTLFPILYKRKYDNVQEYQERKKNRLIKSME